METESYNSLGGYATLLHDELLRAKIDLKSITDTQSFFSCFFQTIQIYPSLVVGRFQKKRSIYPENSNIIEIPMYSVKNQCVFIVLGL